MCALIKEIDTSSYICGIVGPGTKTSWFLGAPIRHVSVTYGEVQNIVVGLPFNVLRLCLNLTDQPNTLTHLQLKKSLLYNCYVQPGKISIATINRMH